MMKISTVIKNNINAIIIDYKYQSYIFLSNEKTKRYNYRKI